MLSTKVYIEADAEGNTLFTVEIAEDWVLVFEKTYTTDYGAASAILGYGDEFALVMTNGECECSVNRAGLEAIADGGAAFLGDVEDVY